MIGGTGTDDAICLPDLDFGGNEAAGEIVNELETGLFGSTFAVGFEPDREGGHGLKDAIGNIT